MTSRLVGSARAFGLGDSVVDKIDDVLTEARDVCKVVNRPFVLVNMLDVKDLRVLDELSPHRRRNMVGLVGRLVFRQPAQTLSIVWIDLVVKTIVEAASSLCKRWILARQQFFNDGDIIGFLGGLE